MKHLQTITPIRTNRNKFNSSSPFRVVFSGTFNRNIYYDLSSAYLKIKIRCKPNQLKTVTKHEGSVTAVTTPAQINDYDGKVPSELAPIIRERIENMPPEVLDSYIKTKGAGSHAEIYAVNKLLLDNPNALCKRRFRRI